MIYAYYLAGKVFFRAEPLNPTPKGWNLVTDDDWNELNGRLQAAGISNPEKPQFLLSEEACQAHIQHKAAADQANAMADAFWDYWTTHVPARIRDNYEPHRVVVNAKMRSGDGAEIASLPAYISNIVNVFPENDADHAGFEVVRSVLLSQLAG